MMTPSWSQTPFRDDFTTEASLQSWTSLEIDGWRSKIRSLAIEDGQLVMEPTSSGWFEDNYAGHLFRSFTGDFELKTRVKVQGTNSALPETAFSLAGLFVRAPRDFSADGWEPGGENWMFFSIGTATAPGTPQFEIKSTFNSQSTLKVYPAKDAWVELAIVRVDEVFSLLHRFDQEEWVLLDQFIRPDLPETLHLGVTAYSDWPSLSEIYPDYETYNKNGTPVDKGDLRAYFEYLAISSTPVKKELPIANYIGQDVLVSLNETTDQQ